MTQSKRILWPDLLKAFAITLVVVGHVVTTFDTEHYNAPVARWIYSFHMPLFMMLSGMFFGYTLDKPFRSMFVTKCRTLLLPLLSWSLILLAFQVLAAALMGGGKPLQIITLWAKAGGPLRGYWYLKCLFLYLIVGYVAVWLLKNKIVAALACIALFLVLPNVNFTRMMIVFFWAGYAYSILVSRIKGRLIWYLMASGAIMTLCYLLGYYKFTYLGFTPCVVNYSKFLLMGASASLFWMLLFQMIFSKPSGNKAIKFCAWVGTVSLGIYCMHALFYLPEVFGPLLGNITRGATAIYLLWSLLTIVVCLVLIKLIQMSRILSFLLLGKRL